MNIIDVTLQEDCAEPPWLEQIEPFLQAVLCALSIENWDLSVVFCTDSFIQNLNKQYRGIDEATDVLSFGDGEPYLAAEENAQVERTAAGDIVISIETLHKNCAYFSVPLYEELSRLLIHGVLHLTGRDHETNDFDSEPMLALQESILTKNILQF